MPVFLNAREPLLEEHMDDPDSDRALLFRTYDRFSTVNKLVSGWNRIFQNLIVPLVKEGETCHILDIGFGGGDIIRTLYNEAAACKFDLRVTGIEIDSRALDYVAGQPWPDTIEFRNTTTADLVNEHLSFDFIISNHLLHHLEQDEMNQMLNDCERLCTRRIIHNDIERSDVAYLFFGPFSRVLGGKSFLCADGLRSIRKSYTYSELTGLVPENWLVYRMFPYRLLLVNG